MSDFTHRVSLWVNNDEAWYNRLVETAKEAAEETEGSTRLTRRAVSEALSRDLNEMFESVNGLNGPMRELLTVALNSVDCDDITHGFADEAVYEWEENNPDPSEDEQKDAEPGDA